MADLIRFFNQIAGQLTTGTEVAPEGKISVFLEAGGQICNAESSFYLQISDGEPGLLNTWNLPVNSLPSEIKKIIADRIKQGLTSGVISADITRSGECPSDHFSGFFSSGNDQVNGMLGMFFTEEHKSCDIVDQVLPMLTWLTEREVSIARLRTETEKLRNAHREKDRFLSIVAHDLKSPFNGFLGLTYLLTDEFETLSREDIAEISVTLRKSALNMYALLENMLIYSRIQRNVLKFEPQELRFYDLVNAVLEGMIGETESKRIIVLNEIDPWMSVTADKSMVTTILQNLISNAVKYSHPGGSVRIRAAYSDKTKVVITVSDHGVGIAEEIRMRLFDTGELVKSAGTAGESGSGLGLIIAKELVEKHKGRLWLDSKPGDGTAVHFTIPHILI